MGEEGSLIPHDELATATNVVHDVCVVLMKPCEATHCDNTLAHSTALIVILC